MKKTIFCVLVCMLLIVSVVIPVTAIPVSKTISYPISMGTILYVGGSGPNNYTRIQDAINDASDGDTVFVYDDSSPYQENLVVDKSISLIGENKKTTFIDGGEIDDCVVLKANKILIQGFTLTHPDSEYYGVRISSHENIIRGNIISNNMIGIHLLDVNYNIIEDNEIIQNYYGGVYQYSCDDTKISNNSISGSTEHGGVSILYESDRTEITCNTITQNNYGIMISCRSNDNTILNNNIMKNTVGICLDMASNNVVEKNNIMDNSVQVGWSGFSWHLAKERWFKNTFDENYWGRANILIKPILGVLLLVYDVKDNGRMGIGFSVFGLIPMIKFDYHPAQEPYDIPGIQ